MKVSCICPTYNRVAARPDLLEEAIESFLKQDYPADKELIVLNDHPGQKIVYTGPQVKVVNYPVRFSTLGEKYNYAIREIAIGDLICTWEDDDISLPHRLSLSVERIGNADYFNPRAYYFACGGSIKLEYPAQGYAHNCSMFTRKAFVTVGGYPFVSGPQDAHMDGLLRSHCKVVDGLKFPEETFFIYRWGVSDMHLSGQADTQKAYNHYASEATKTGTYYLYPHWAHDYRRDIPEA
jgi:glycosyltransferase involved in cell wall biosynthesis